MESSRDLPAFAKLPLLVSLSVFSDWTGLDRWTVMQMRRDGAIGSVRVGRRHRYLKADIARLAKLPLAS